MTNFINSFKKVEYLLGKTKSNRFGLPVLFQLLTVLTVSAIIFISCENNVHHDNTSIERTIALNERADSLQRAGDYPHALDSLLLARQEIDKNPDMPDSVKIVTFFHTGRIYSIYQDLDAAIRNYTKALELQSQKADKEIIFKVYSNMFAAYSEQGSFEMADSINEAMNRVEISNPTYRRFLYYFNKGYLCTKNGNPGKALEYFDTAERQIAGVDSLESYKVFTYSEIANCYNMLDKSDSAYKYLKAFEQTANMTSEPYVRISAMKELMLWAAKNGDAPMAADYIERYFATTDSLVNLRAFLKAKENIRQYDEETSNNKIDNMAERLTERQRWLVNLSLSLVVMTLIAVFAVWRTVIVNRNNKLLYSKNVELTKIEHQYRDLLLSQNDQEHDRARPDRSPAEADKNYNRELLEKIIREMNDNKPYLNAEYSLQSLAAAVGSNTKYVSQVINDALDKNFRGFINEYRVREAERRLKDTANYGHYTIQAIAESVGIKSKATFVAAFRKVTGLTPSVYVRMSKNDGRGAETLN